jgi:hypothetical protein
MLSVNEEKPRKMKQLFILFSLILFSLSYGMAQTGSFAPSSDSDVVSIYPNPVTDMEFYVSADETVTSVEVLNVIGQTIKTVKNETQVPYNILVQLPNPKTGMYLVRVTTQNGSTYLRKVLVK